MRYLCIVHVDPSLIAELSDAEGLELTRECRAYDQQLLNRGKLIAAEALDRPEAARIVRMRNRKATVTDGPYAETKEFLGGFLFIEARDLDEATEIASACPMARMGSIEVRPQLIRQAQSTDCSIKESA